MEYTQIKAYMGVITISVLFFNKIRSEINTSIKILACLKSEWIYNDCYTGLIVLKQPH